METGNKIPWSPPSIEIRDEFLFKMQSLASRFISEDIDTVDEPVDVQSENLDETELTTLLNTGEFAAAFFLSRRLLSRGEEWAQPYLEQAKQGLESEDDVHIP